MLLRNYTKCPDDLLLPLIKHAAMCIGATTKDVVIEIRQGWRKQERISGLALCHSWHQSAGAYCHQIRLVLPRCQSDEVSFIRRVWDVIAHEWGHIYDYQREDRGEKLEWARYANAYAKRAIAHDSRPQEIRANRYVEVAKAMLADGVLRDCEDAVLDLAVWVESKRMNTL